MSWPLLVAGAIGLLAEALRTPGSGSNNKAKGEHKLLEAPSRSSASSSSDRRHASSGHSGSIFFSGLVTGVCFGAYAAHEIRKRKLIEWCWQKLLAATNIKSSDNRNQKLTLIEAAVEEAEDLGEGVTVRRIVIPEWSSSMEVSLLTIPNGGILLKKRTMSVEFYYVVQGTCTISTRSVVSTSPVSFPSSKKKQQDQKNATSNKASTSAVASLEVSKGEILVLDPWTERSLSNNGFTETWVLRGSDNAGTGTDAVDLEGMKAKASTASKILSSGIQQVESLIGAYSSTKAGNSGGSGSGGASSSNEAGN